uniref:Uncharacterized protein n=1 Tax=Arundo donax TaxID=35708 RepID=A0A0A8ZJL8_ARUDO
MLSKKNIFDFVFPFVDGLKGNFGLCYLVVCRPMLADFICVQVAEIWPRRVDVVASFFI